MVRFSKKWASVSLLTLLFYSASQAQESAPDSDGGPRSSIQLSADWEKKEVFREAPVFMRRQGDVIESITFLENSSPTAAQAPESVVAFRKKLEVGVKPRLARLGIRDWKVTDVEVASAADGKLFKVRGTYLGSAGQRVYFEEWKYYLGRGFAQVTFSEEGRQGPSEPQKVAAVLRLFSPFGDKI
jgi:hypothetical protein